MSRKALTAQQHACLHFAKHFPTQYNEKLAMYKLRNSLIEFPSTPTEMENS